MEEMEESSIVLCKPGRHSQWHRHLRDVKKKQTTPQKSPQTKKGTNRHEKKFSKALKDIFN